MRNLVLIFSLLLVACDEPVLNNPYPNQPDISNSIYLSFSAQPKHLDPARSYTDAEWIFIGQIYEPPLEYNYQQRPYTLQGLTAAKLPQIKYDPRTHTTTYTITIKPGIYYQPHPAFAIDGYGQYYYHNLTNAQAGKYHSIDDFVHTGTRELKAADYIYQIKRLADPSVNSPVFGYFSNYIVGLSDLRKNLLQQPRDLRNVSLAGARIIDDYTYEIVIKGKNPYFKYWLAITFFAPMPWEAIEFYAQPGFKERNISLDWYPVGTGAYYLSQNNPERRMLLKRNPNFHENIYAGQRLPLVDEIIFSREKESLPYWDKFIQGYYDSSGISSDTFNSVISSNANNNLVLNQKLLDRGLRLRISPMPTLVYWGFNMLDPTVGGYSDKSRKLRRAISLAIDIEEYIAIFLNGRAIPASNPVPPEIFGYKESKLAPYAERLAEAQRLMQELGYKNGLQMYFDTNSTGDPDEKALLTWIRKQLAKINIDLIIRATDYNRFSEKLRTGTAQMFRFGWHADYPDPENFFSLFYSKNTAAQNDGINSTNYSSQEFDQLFTRFETTIDDNARARLIEQMLAVLQRDAPMVYGYFPQSFALFQPWYYSEKPNPMAQNVLKYVKVEPELRAEKRQIWNKPTVWPFFFCVLVVILLVLPAWFGYKKRDRQQARRFN